jgi:hypothetical protein
MDTIGGTVSMSLPKADLVKGRRVALPFSYEWESEGDGIEHEAFFYARELPPKAGGFPPATASTAQEAVLMVRKR